MPWAVLVQWSRSPRAWAEALDSNAALSQVRDEMERYNAREVWGPCCERCRIYCDINDLEEILKILRDGVTMTRLLEKLPCEARGQQEDFASDSCGARGAVRPSASKVFTLSMWTQSYTLCPELLLEEMMKIRCKVKKVRPTYMRWIYL